MQDGIVDEEAAAEPVFVGALEGRSCCAGLEDLEVWPKLIINVYLRGGQQFVMDGVPFAESADAAGHRPRISMINVRRHCRIHFNSGDQGARLRKVKVSIPLAWIERELGGVSSGSPALDRFFSLHLGHFAFDPTPDLVALAEQISHPPPSVKGDFLTLYRKVRGLELMRLCCAALVEQAGEADHKPSRMGARQSERVRHYIMANLTRDLTIESIARETGASVSSVQRHFKQHFGMTVFEYIRRKRLEAARDALENQGVTVAEAAWIAGYQSSSSFITAFKKTYGACPGDIRA